MAEEQKLDEGKSKETAEIEIGGKKYDAKKLAETIENQPKLVTEYQESQRLLRETREEIERLKQEHAKPKESETKTPKLSEIPLDSEQFIPTLVKTLESVDERVTRLMAQDDERVKGDIQKAGVKNGMLLDKFSLDNELTPDEKERVKKIAAVSDQNEIIHGKMPIISPLALEDALIVVRKDRIIARSKAEGKEATIAQIFGKQETAKTAEHAGGEEPTAAWLAEHWQELNEEQRQKYRRKLYPGQK